MSFWLSTALMEFDLVRPGGGGPSRNHSLQLPERGRGMEPEREESGSLRQFQGEARRGFEGSDPKALRVGTGPSGKEADVEDVLLDEIAGRQVFPSRFPQLRRRFANGARAKAEAAVSDEVRGFQKAARDPVVIAGKRRADPVPLSGELFDSGPERESVVLDDQDFRSREPFVEPGDAVHAHGFHVPGRNRPQGRFDLYFDETGEPVRELQDGACRRVGHDNGLHRSEMPPGLVDGAFRERKQRFRRFRGPEEIGENRDAVRSFL